MLTVALAMVCAIVSHRLMKSYLFASLCAALAAAILFEIVAYLSFGYLDPFFIIVFATSSLISLVVALAVGVVFFIVRRTRAGAAPKNGFMVPQE